MDQTHIARITERAPLHFSVKSEGRLWGADLSAEIMLPAPEAGAGAILRATVGFFPDRPPTAFVGVLIPAWPIALGTCVVRASHFPGPDEARYSQAEALASDTIDPALGSAGVPALDRESVLAATRAAIVARATPHINPTSPAWHAGSDAPMAAAPPPPDAVAVRDPSVLDREPLLHGPYRLALPVEESAPGALLLSAFGFNGPDIPKTSIAHLVPYRPLFTGAIGSVGPRPGLPAPNYVTIGVTETDLWNGLWEPHADTPPSLEEKRATIRRILLAQPGTASNGYETAEQILRWVIEALGVTECSIRGDTIKARSNRTPPILDLIMRHYRVRGPKPLAFGAVNDEHLGVARDAFLTLSAEGSAHAAMRAAGGLDAWSREAGLLPDEQAFRRKVCAAIKAHKARRAKAS